MGLIEFLFLLVVIGVVIGLILPKIPMDSTIRQIVYVVVILVVIWMCLGYFGLVSGGPIFHGRSRL